MLHINYISVKLEKTVGLIPYKTVEAQGKPKNTGVGSLSLLQWISPTQKLNQHLLHCRWILYQLSYHGIPPYKQIFLKKKEGRKEGKEGKEKRWRGGRRGFAGDVCLLSLRLTLSPPFSLQCSVSCGVGTQRRLQTCQKLTAKGRRVPLSESLCRHLSGPPLVRSCQMPVCRSKYGNPHRGPCSFSSPPPVASFSIEQLVSGL